MPVARRVPLFVKLAIALVGIVTLVLLINGAVNRWLNYEKAKRAAVGVQQDKARAAAEYSFDKDAKGGARTFRASNLFPGAL